MKDRPNRWVYETKLYKAKLAYSRGGKAVCNGRISINRNFGDGDKPEWESVWFNVVSFEDAAHAMAECADGTNVQLEGYLTVSKSWTGKDGVRREAQPELVAEVVRILDPVANRSVPITQPPARDAFGDPIEAEQVPF